MKRASGFLLPLLLVLLVIPAVAAIGYEPVNGLFGLDETKIQREEEVTVLPGHWFFSETLAAYAVESKPSLSTGTPGLLTTVIDYGHITDGGREISEGGIRASPGGL